jgi:adenylate cyclase
MLKPVPMSFAQLPASPDLPLASSSPKRRQILDGARKAFYAHGYAGASMDQIAALAGVSKGTLYVYFANKEALFQALVAEEADQFAGRLPPVDPDASDIRSVLRQSGLGFLHALYHEETIRALRTIVGAAEQLPHLSRYFYDAGLTAGVTQLQALLDQRIAAGDLAVEDAQSAARKFLTLCCSAAALPLLLMKAGEPPTAAESEAVVEDAVIRFMMVHGVTRPYKSEETTTATRAGTSCFNSPAAERLLSWLFTAGIQPLDLPSFYRKVCRRFDEAGVRLAGVDLHLGLLHAANRSVSLTWRSKNNDIRQTLRPHGSSPAFDLNNGPIHAALTSKRPMHCRVDHLPQAAWRSQLAEEGITDIYIVPLKRTTTTDGAIIWMSDDPSGFGASEIQLIDVMMPFLVSVLDTRYLRWLCTSLLETYVGHSSGGRILNGRVRRGDAEEIQAVLWLSDLRDFTTLTESLPSDELIGTLDAYLDAVAGHLHEFGGEILKFMGDAVLAIFPCDDETKRDAAQRALRAASEAKHRLALLNDARKAEGLPLLHTSLALHIGTVLFGNIGTAQRLDFTAIGKDVNLLARLEALSKGASVSPLLSEAFANLNSGPTECLGRHQLRGFAKPQLVFTSLG